MKTNNYISSFQIHESPPLGVGVVEVELGSSQGSHDRVEDTDCEETMGMARMSKRV
jgi:hypothetical protein